MALPPDIRKVAFVSLAAIAGLALAMALIATLVPFNDAGTWLISILVVLVIVVLAEIVLLVLDRSGEPPAEAETYDFVIESDVGGDSR